MNNKNFKVSLTKEELEKICAFPENYETLNHSDLYSNKYILKKMFFYPFNKFYVSIQHGLWLKKIKNELSEGEILNNYRYALYDRPILQQYGIKILSIEHPFLFYKRKFNITQKNTKGTIVFPLHTLTTFDIEYPIEKYIEQLKRLPQKFHPLLICLHFSDVINNRHHIWYDNGFEVTSAGNGFREDFVKRFYDILSSVKYATSNESTSGLYYAIDLDIPVFIYGNNVSDDKQIIFKTKFADINLENEEYLQNNIKKYNLNKFFPTSPTTKISKITQQHVDDILGKTYPKNNKLYVNFILYKEWFRFKIKDILIKLQILKYKKYIDEKSLDISNHMTLEEKIFLIKYAKNKIVAEIGSFLGSNTINLANIAKKVYAVDNWKRHQIDNSYKIFKINISNKKNIEILNGEFEIILDKIQKDIDLVIIDGEHYSYEVICRDIKKTYPKLKKGGYIIIHHLKWSIHIKKCIYAYLINKVQEIEYLDNLWIGKKL